MLPSLCWLLLVQFPGLVAGQLLAAGFGRLDMVRRCECMRPSLLKSGALRVQVASMWLFFGKRYCAALFACGRHELFVQVCFTTLSRPAAPDRRQPVRQCRVSLLQRTGLGQ